MKFSTLFYIVLSLCVLCVSNAANADDAQLCSRETQRFERLGAIPTGLLQSLSLVETGRKVAGKSELIAWPWTINAAGEGFYYASKAEAVAAAKDFLASGVQSIDVGCMQINLKYHPDAFHSLEQAFSPHHNVAYAATFIRKLYEKNKNWMVAAKHYHSTEPHKNIRYGNKVKTVLASISDGKLPSFVSEVAGALSSTVKTASLDKAQERTQAARKANQWRAQRLAEYHRRKELRQSRNL